MMSDRRVPFFVLAIAAAATLAGCSGSERGLAPQASDEEVVRSLVLHDPEISAWFATDLFADRAPSPASPLELSQIGILASWRRQPEPGGVSVGVEVHISGDQAWVKTTTTTEGDLVLREWVGGDIVVHTKPMADKAVRYARMQRVGDTWVLRDISHLSVGSCLGGAAPSVAIENVELAGGGEAILVEDCSAMYPVDAIPTLPAGANATATIVTGDVSGHAYFFMGARPAGPDRGEDIAPGPDGAYEVGWRTPLRAGVYNATVDFIEHDAIYETDPRLAPYDARSWVITYRVRRGGAN